MKTLKVLLVAVLVLSSSVVFSKPTNKNLIQAKKEVKKDFQKALVWNNITEDMEPNTSTNVLVYYQLDEENNIEILKTVCPCEEMGEKVEEIFSKKDVKAPSVLQGSIHKLNIRLIKEL